MELLKSAEILTRHLIELFYRNQTEDSAEESTTGDIEQRLIGQIFQSFVESIDRLDGITNTITKEG